VQVAIGHEEFVARISESQAAAPSMSFTQPAVGHYAFDVILDDFTSVNGGPVFLQNRSETFTQTAFSPVPEPSTLGLMIFSVGALTGLAVRRKSPK
jgi:hypothetical protein